jgi:hypothetical protein
LMKSEPTSQKPPSEHRYTRKQASTPESLGAHQTITGR